MSMLGPSWHPDIEFLLADIKARELAPGARGLRVVRDEDYPHHLRLEMELPNEQLAEALGAVSSAIEIEVGGYRGVPVKVEYRDLGATDTRASITF